MKKQQYYLPEQPVRSTDGGVLATNGLNAGIFQMYKPKALGYSPVLAMAKYYVPDHPMHWLEGQP